MDPGSSGPLGFEIILVLVHKKMARYFCGRRLSTKTKTYLLAHDVNVEEALVRSILNLKKMMTHNDEDGDH